VLQGGQNPIDADGQRKAGAVRRPGHARFSPDVAAWLLKAGAAIFKKGGGGAENELDLFAACDRLLLLIPEQARVMGERVRGVVS
jgi:hypothetical protein